MNYNKFKILQYVLYALLFIIFSLIDVLITTIISVSLLIYLINLKFNKDLALFISVISTFALYLYIRYNHKIYNIIDKE